MGDYTMSEIDELIERMTKPVGEGFILILNKEGNVLEMRDPNNVLISTQNRSDKNLSKDERDKINKIRELVDKAKTFVRECEPEQITDFIKFSISEVYDLMVCPEKEFTLIVLQPLKGTGN